MGQGTPPVQRGRRIRSETSPRYDDPYQVVDFAFPVSGPSTLVSFSNNKHKGRSRPQGNRTQRQAFSRVIRDHARRRGHTWNTAQGQDQNFISIQTARPRDYASGLSKSHPYATQKDTTQERDKGCTLTPTTRKRLQRRARAKVNRLRHVEGSIRGGR